MNVDPAMLVNLEQQKIDVEKAKAVYMNRLVNLAYALLQFAFLMICFQGTESIHLRGILVFVMLWVVAP